MSGARRLATWMLCLLVPAVVFGADCDEICWDDADAVAALDSNLLPEPIQVMEKDDEDHYSVRYLDTTTGEYVFLYELDYFDGHVEVVAMFESPSGDAYYAFASMSGFLCRFDGEQSAGQQQGQCMLEPVE